MSDQLIAERGGLEKKDKSELQAIVEALGGTATSRARKADLIDQIIELSQQVPPADPEAEAEADVDVETEAETDSDSDTGGDTDEDAIEDEVEVEADDAAESPSSDDAAAADGATSDHAAATAGEADSANGSGVGDASAAEAGSGRRSSARSGRGSRASSGADDGDSTTTQGKGRDGRGSGGTARRQGGDGSKGGRNRSGSGGGSAESHPVGPDGEPLADWEVELVDDGQAKGGNQGSGNQGGGKKGKKGNNDRNNDRKNDGRASDGGSDKDGDGDVDPNNRRSRRRGRGRGRDRDDAGNDPISSEPVPVAGSLDLREEGYGFLRVAGHLQSKDDVYVSVKQVRQYGLRKGDRLTGLSRPANRNEKNPGFHQIDTVNGKAPDEARKRPRFDDLTPLFPDERLTMEMKEEPLNMTTRIIDLVSPIGKGQRGLIVSPPKAGKTTVMKDIARAIETNNPEVHLIMLLVDERPEEVTDIQRSLRNGEVASSTFDRPPEEHCAVAELTIERAKRMVEAGQDVCIIVDGITRLARAYNLTAPQTGRAMSGGVDAGALYPPKRFFGAARNVEEGGSLTILATALVDTGSRMDEVIFEEFKGTGNMELRLDRRLAEKRIFPAIDVDGSSTRHEELLFDPKELKLAWKLRRVLSAMGDEGSSSAGVEMLVERLATFKTNADFLAEMAKTPSV